MARQPSVKVNGYEIGDHPSRRIVWAETEGLLEATKQAPWQAFETFSGPGRNMAGDMDYPVRRLSIVVRITKQDGFLSKHEALAVLSEIFSGQPAIVQVGSLYLEAEFQPPQVVKDAWKLTSGYLTVRFDGEAIPGTFWGEYGFQQGREQGIIVQDDRPDHPGLIFTGNAFTVHNPGTAPTEAVVSVTNTALPDTTVYLLGTKGQMMPVNLDSTGYGRIDEAYGFVLYPGANRIQIVNASGSPIGTGTFSTCFYGTRWRFLGNTDGRFEDGPVFQFARTGPATYLSPDGLKTAGDGVARIGLPWVVRRNLLTESNDFHLSSWVKQGGASAPTVSAGARVYHVPGIGEVAFARVVFPDTNPSVASLYKTFAQIADGQTYTLTLYVAGSGDMQLRLRQDVAPFTNYGILTVSLTPTPQRITLTATKTAGDGYSGVLRFSIHGAGASEVYIYGAQPELGSTATPYQPTNATGVDLTHPLNGAGLVLEGASTNLLTANQSNVETDTSGFSGSDATYLSGTSTISRSGAQKFEGSYSLAVTTPGAAASEGVVLTGLSGRAANTTHTWWGMAYIPSGVAVSFLLRDHTNGITGTAFTLVGTGGWQPFACQVTTGGTAATIIPIARTSSQVATTFYLDMMQVEPSPFPTSWHLGGTTRQPDRVGIVPPHNLLKWSERFDNAVWQKFNGAISATGVAGPEGLADAFTFNATSTGSPHLRQALALQAGKTYCPAIWVRRNTGTGDIVGDLGDGAAITQPLTSAWQRVSFPTTKGAQSWFDLRFTATGTYDICRASLVEGSHPGIYVPTTDTPILPPPSPALDPAWSQNGRLTGSFVLPVGANTATGTAILGGGGLTITQKASTIELSRTTAAGTRTISVAKNAADGYSHALDASWTHYTDSAGVRKMILTLTVDGVTSTADVAALYGDTRYADLDASRLVSAGSVFATWRDLVPTWPALPAGATPAT